MTKLPNTFNLAQQYAARSGTLRGSIEATIDRLKFIIQNTSMDLDHKEQRIAFCIAQLEKVLQDTSHLIE